MSTFFYIVIRCPSVGSWDSYIVNTSINVYMTTISVTCTNNRNNTNNETETTHTCTEEGTWIPQIHACQGK